MQMLKMCLNYRVLAALGAVGAGIYFVAPGLLAAALPLLVLAICPLSMLVMMKGMSGAMHHGTAPASAAGYTCPMHSAVRSEQPGACPSCGMPLRSAQEREPARIPVEAAVSGDAPVLQQRLNDALAEQARLSREVDGLRSGAENRAGMLAAADRLEADVNAALASATGDAEAREQLPT